MTEKTVLVNYTGRNGAGPIFAYEMTRGLLQNGVKVVAIISSGIENLQEWKKLELEKLVVISTYSTKWNCLINTLLFPFRQKRMIRKQMGRYSFDAIYIPMMCIWTKRINRIFPKTPTYDTVHDPIPHSGEKCYLKGYKPTANTKRIIVLSEQFTNYVEKMYHKPSLWIPHGRFSYYKEKYFTDYAPSDTINYLFFGRLEEYKGLKVLAQAFKKVSPELGNFTLTIAGPGNWDAYAKDFEGIPNLTVWNRWYDPKSINDLYARGNIVTILPYLDASQSGVIPIAQEYGSPVIASNTGGLREQIEDNVTGYLFSTGNSDALAECIKRVNDDFQHAKLLARNASARLENLNWDKLARKLMEAIDEDADYIHADI